MLCTYTDHHEVKNVLEFGDNFVPNSRHTESSHAKESSDRGRVAGNSVHPYALVFSAPWPA